MSSERVNTITKKKIETNQTDAPHVERLSKVIENDIVNLNTLKKLLESLKKVRGQKSKL
jgi:hypothetical protein